MKTPTKPTAPRMPRARVMHACVFSDRRMHSVVPDSEDGWRSPVTVIDPNTGNKKRDAQQARKLAAFFNQPEHKMVSAMGCMMGKLRNGKTWPISADELAAAVLAAITGGRA